MKQDGKVIGKVGLQFGNSLRTNAEIHVLEWCSIKYLLSLDMPFLNEREGRGHHGGHLNDAARYKSGATSVHMTKHL